MPKGLRKHIRQEKARIRRETLDFKKQEEFMEPVLEKINTVIKKIGDEEKFDFIFDTAAGNILYASENQPDLTDQVLKELEKGVTANK